MLTVEAVLASLDWGRGGDGGVMFIYGDRGRGSVALWVECWLGGGRGGGGVSVLGGL